VLWPVCDRSEYILPVVGPSVSFIRRRESPATISNVGSVVIRAFGPVKSSGQGGGVVWGNHTAIPAISYQLWYRTARACADDSEAGLGCFGNHERPRVVSTSEYEKTSRRAYLRQLSGLDEAEISDSRYAVYLMQEGTFAGDPEVKRLARKVAVSLVCGDEHVEAFAPSTLSGEKEGPIRVRGVSG
jgi:hypothetical protein